MPLIGELGSVDTKPAPGNDGGKQKNAQLRQTHRRWSIKKDIMATCVEH